VLCAHEIAPQVAGEGLRPWPMRLWEPALFGAGEGAVTVIAVPTSDGFGEDAVMWVVRAGGRSVLHGGDVMWHAHWWRIGAALGPFDMAFLPINGAVVRGRAPHVDLPRTLTPEQAVAACVALGARALCPIHYGLDDPPSYVEAPDALPRALRAGALNGIRVVAAAEGQWLEFASGT
jgi:L-ascorbate metabolism protein UlaG (beta-lactamase superfamily)